MINLSSVPTTVNTDALVALPDNLFGMLTDFRTPASLRPEERRQGILLWHDEGVSFPCVQAGSRPLTAVLPLILTERRISRKSQINVASASVGLYSKG